MKHWSYRFGRVSVALLAAALAACSSSPKKPEPAPLAPVTALVPATQAWQVQLGGFDPLMTPAVKGRQLAVADAQGIVSVIDAQSGAVAWRHDLKAVPATGLGFDGQTAALVTRNNELVALSAGQALWRVRLSTRVFTAPLVAGQRVFVLQGDRAVLAFDANTGARLWAQPLRKDDPLVLQQAGMLTAVGDTLVAGISGRVTGIHPGTGSVRWEAPIASPRGVNEIERLVDLVRGAGRVGDELCVRAFQSAVGCVDAARGVVRWTKPADGAVGVDADQDHVYGTESNGRVLAWKRDSGAVAWSSDRLLHRGLTAPLAAGRSIVVGDVQGWVHLLSRDDGTVLNRLPTDGSAVVGAPVLVAGTLVAITRKGGVFGWRPQ